MFGYIAPVMNTLTEPQQARYKEAYCGLCLSLAKRSGHFGRITLSNDITFLAILVSSLYEPEESEKRIRCTIHPVKQRTARVSPLFDFAADMNILLMYYKLEDQRRDEHGPAGRIGSHMLRKAMDRIRSDWPDQCREVSEALEKLWKLEDDPGSAGAELADTLCNLSGQMLGAVFVPKPDDIWARGLRAVGEGLGRFVYWMDAYEDLKKDVKHNRFNPLRSYMDRPDFESFCKDTLEMLISEATEPFELLPLEKDLDILRNILYSGVWQRYQLMQDRKSKVRSDG